MIIPIGMAISAENTTATAVYCRCSTDPGGQAGGTAPVGRGEDVGQRLLQEVHAGRRRSVASAGGRPPRAARTHGVIARPAT